MQRLTSEYRTQTENARSLGVVCRSNGIWEVEELSLGLVDGAFLQRRLYRSRSDSYGVSHEVNLQQVPVMSMRGYG